MSQPTPSLAARLATIGRHWLGWIPPKARLAVLAGVLVLIGLAVYAFLTSGSATLNLVCRHNLRAADLSLLVDGKLAFTEQISGSAKKRFGIFKTGVAGSFSKSLTLPSGEHVIQVHLKSPADSFDQTRRCGVNLLPEKGTTLQITAQRGSMSLLCEGPPVAAAKSHDSDYSSVARSLLVTVFGSVASAAIGFMVQEFLRSRKKSPPGGN